MIVRHAPAKLNLGLCVGGVGDDGLHRIGSLFAPLDLADELVFTELDPGPDEILCPAVDAPDLSAKALELLREEGWDGPALRIEVRKRIPIAAGLAGGSADAAAVLRVALDAWGADRLRAIGARLGADVPSQIEPSFSFVAGVGEEVEQLPDPGGFAAVLVPGEAGLAAGEVYAEADRLGTTRSEAGLTAACAALVGAARAGRCPLDYSELLVNDLQPAAISLQPAIEARLRALREVGAAVSMISGSGPTAVGLFADLDAAERAAGEIEASGGEPIVCSLLGGVG